MHWQAPRCGQQQAPTAEQQQAPTAHQQQTPTAHQQQAPTAQQQQAPTAQPVFRRAVTFQRPTSSSNLHAPQGDKTLISSKQLSSIFRKHSHVYGYLNLITF
jgi:phage terminase large subunit GpA-like protein